MVATSPSAIWAYVGARITISPTGCWIWAGALSQSGGRGVFYPVMRLDRRMVRIPRLVLYLGARATHPQRDGETFRQWLSRVRRAHVWAEASHRCDHSTCVNPQHLGWETHRDNVQGQANRRRQEAAAA